MQKPSSIRQCFVFVLLISFAVALVSVRAGAQAVPIKQKKADLSTFFGYTKVTPDYGPLINGVVFGGFYTRYLHWFAPAVEFRAKIANGTGVDQKTYGGGIRVEKDFHQLFRPYGDFLVSSGTINYHLVTPPNQPAPPGIPYVLHTYSDSSVVYTYGGGLDVDITENFSARGEYQHENWSLGKYGPVTLTPSMWGFGVVYRIPFRPHLGR